MKREYLEGLGLEKDVIDRIMGEHGKTVNAVRSDLTTVTTERDNLKIQLGERDTRLNGLSEQVKDNKELTRQIDELKEGNKTATEELQTKLDQQAFDFSLEKALTGAKVRNPKAVKALLNTESIKLDGEKLLGLDDQITALKESDAYLFEVEETPNPSPQIVFPGNPNGGAIANNPFSKEHWNLTEQGKLFKENPDLYNNMKAQSGK